MNIVWKLIEGNIYYKIDISKQEIYLFFFSIEKKRQNLFHSMSSNIYCIIIIGGCVIKDPLHFYI